MRQAETFAVTVRKEAQDLRGRLGDELFESILEAIETARNGVMVSNVDVRRSREPDDGKWEQVVFDVHVPTCSDEALQYWGRIGQRLDDLIGALPPERAEEVSSLVAVHVEWHDV
jgi:hypothetical protein